MKTRIDVARNTPPGAYKALMGVQQYVDTCGLEPALLDLVLVRFSQINGCAYCIDLHTKDARKHGEREQRLYELDAWRESPFYTDRERAALAWAEAVTLITVGHVPDEVFAEAHGQFSDADLINLTIAITLINSWNRISIAFRRPPAEHELKLAA
jgi:AhpD family alkylhydroperoxidase